MRNNCLLKDCTLTRLYSSTHTSDIHMGPCCWPLNISSFQDILSHTETSSICTFLFYKCSSVLYLYINFPTLLWLIRNIKCLRLLQESMPPLPSTDPKRHEDRNHSPTISGRTAGKNYCRLFSKIKILTRVCFS